MAGDAGTELSKGGMKTKVEAARIAMAAGTDMVITTGKPLHPLQRITDGAVCTWFVAPSDPVTAKKRWIAGQLEPKGQVTVDAGAEIGRGCLERLRDPQNRAEGGVALLEASHGISDIALQVVAEHHERFDGTGYPQAKAREGISLYGQMASIVDVYDAISSERVYHRGMAPTQALKKLLEWSTHHFDQHLVQAFIRSIGIYPSGTLVQLESKRLGVVVEQHEAKLLEPVVKVFYHAGHEHYITPEIVDLAKVQDRIASCENYDKWKIDPHQWLPG